MLSFSKVGLWSIVLGSFLFYLPLSVSYAAAGCCSHHGGVMGCNTSTNHQLCKDGTTSPTCLCSGGKAAKTSRKQSMSKTGASTTATPAAVNSTASTSPKAKQKGCCARHGGVAGCDKSSGYQICKDGTRSATCKC